MSSTTGTCINTLSLAYMTSLHSFVAVQPSLPLSLHYRTFLHLLEEAEQSPEAYAQCFLDQVRGHMTMNIAVLHIM